MEKQAQQKLGLKVGSMVLTIIIIIVIIRGFSGNLFGSKAIDASEKYVNQQVYESLGLVCESFNSERIYKDGNIELISVQFYFDGSTVPIGSYCVYCVDGYVCNSTTMMGADYDFKDSLRELKALFGI